MPELTTWLAYVWPYDMRAYKSGVLAIIVIIVMTNCQVARSQGAANPQNAIPAWKVASPEQFRPGYYYWPAYGQRPSDAKYFASFDDLSKMNIQVTGKSKTPQENPEPPPSPPIPLSARPANHFEIFIFIGVIALIFFFAAVVAGLVKPYSLRRHQQLSQIVRISDENDPKGLIKTQPNRQVAAELPPKLKETSSFHEHEPPPPNVSPFIRRAATFSLLAPFLSLVFFPAFILGLFFGVVAMIGSIRYKDNNSFWNAFKGTYICGMVTMLLFFALIKGAMSPPRPGVPQWLQHLVGFLQQMGLSAGFVDKVGMVGFVAMLPIVFLFVAFFFRYQIGFLIWFIIFPFRLLKHLITGEVFDQWPGNGQSSDGDPMSSKHPDSEGRYPYDPHYNHRHSRGEDSIIKW